MKNEREKAGFLIVKVVDVVTGVAVMGRKNEGALVTKEWDKQCQKYGEEELWAEVQWLFKPGQTRQGREVSLGSVPLLR